MYRLRTRTFFFSSRRRHTRSYGDWSSDVCSSDLKNSSYRPPTEYSAFTTTAVALRSIKLYPIPGRREEFKERVDRARRWLLSAKASSTEERSMQLNALADAGAAQSDRAPFVKALQCTQNEDGSWS